MKSQREFEEALRGQVRRRVGIANPAASGEEVEGVVEEVVGGGGGAYGYEDGGRIFQVCPCCPLYVSFELMGWFPLGLWCAKAECQ